MKSQTKTGQTQTKTGQTQTKTGQTQTKIKKVKPTFFLRILLYQGL
ncbi:hypothetical protein ODV21_09780 [Lactobacillus amylovorus]|nr:hypothetical protein [Lactobacillus amylovorus]